MNYSKKISLSEKLQVSIDSEIQRRFNISLSDSNSISKCIIQLSDFFLNNPGKPTPWNEPWCQIAYLSYFLPLNVVRVKKVLHRIEMKEVPSQIFDFGSGPLTGLFSLSEYLSEQLGESDTIRRHDVAYIPVEKSIEATNLGKNIYNDFFSESTRIKFKIYDDLKSTTNPNDFGGFLIKHLRKNDEGSTLAFFSYSLVEMMKPNSIPDWLLTFPQILIIEPSTRESSRNLLTLRKEFIKKGYHVVAPCTHQFDCPLLEESKSDWCHDRVHFDIPTWFEKIENFLPMKNRTLTMSYLYLAKPELTGDMRSSEAVGRLVGDLVIEKGKSKQLLCFDNKKRYVSWLHRNIEPTECPRGDLVKLTDEVTGQIQKQEIRLESNLVLVN